MARYILRRLLQAVPILLGASLVTFLIVHLAPGGPIEAYSNPRVSHETINQMVHQLGLDRPLYEQYFVWLKGMLTFNFGWSFTDGRLVTQVIADRLPATLILMGSALLVTVAVAIPLGIVGAIHQYSSFDYALTTYSYVGLATPSFWLGLMLMFVFAVKLRLFPTNGMHAYGDHSLGDLLRHLALPVASLAIQQIAGWSRYMRATMLEVVRQDYVRTARAKGLSDRVVLYKHALRNALGPIVTLLGLSFPGLIGGAAITESIFSWPGLGQVSIQATFGRDYPVVMGFIMVTALAVVIGNLLADIGYALIDPRVRY